MPLSLFPFPGSAVNYSYWGVASFSLVAIDVGARSNEQLQECAQAKAQDTLSWRCPPALNAHLASGAGRQ